MLKHRRFFAAGLAALLLLLCSCQPTPESNAVTQKGDLESAIQRTPEPTMPAAQSEAPSATEKPRETWQLEKEYENGKLLTIDAAVINGDAMGAPVVSLREKPFEDSAELEKISRIICPDFEFYEWQEHPKSIVEKALIMRREELQETIEKGEDTEWLEQRIKELEAEYLIATDDYLPTMDYQLKEKDDGSCQLNLVAKKGNSGVDLDFVNWMYRPGSLFMVYADDSSSWGGVTPQEPYLIPSALEGDAAFDGERARMEQLLADMGIDYMELNAVSRYGTGFEYYFTRSVGGFAETYTRIYMGSMQTDNEQVANLWEPESFRIRTFNGRIVSAEWANPSEITKVDNENAKIIPLEEAKEIFLRQMDYMLKPDVDTKEGKDYSALLEANTKILISKVELGMTKLLVKDGKDEYRLIPTWSFMGCEDGATGKYLTEEQTCFVTINALDGSIVNRAAMY